MTNWFDSLHALDPVVLSQLMLMLFHCCCSFLPPIAMSDDYDGVDVSNNPKPVYYFTVLGNDINPLKTDLKQVVLLDASGATTTSITLDNNVGILTVVSSCLSECMFPLAE